MARTSLLLALGVLWLRCCQAVPWIGAVETPLGLMATAGMSPRPTGAPGLKGFPKELKPRAGDLFPPPPNWCGFVEGVAGEYGTNTSSPSRLIA